MKINFIFLSFHLVFLLACHLLQQGASSSVFKNSSDVQSEKGGFTKGVCPSGWVLNPSKKKCFGYLPSSLSWDDSESICKKYYGHLAAVTSFEELNLVQNLCHDAVTNSCWVGGRVVNDTTVGSNGWKWSDNTTQWWNQSDAALYNMHPYSSMCTRVSNNVTIRMLIAEQCNASHPLLCMRDLENKCHYGIQCHQEYLIILAVVSGLILCTTLAVVVWLLVYRRSKRRKRSRKLCNPAASSAALVTSSPSWKVFTSEELKSITKNFSEGNRLVGDAKTGGTYSGVLPDGSKVAVKRLKRSGFQRKKDFLSEVGRVGRLQHENLVAVKGCCYDHGDRYLVYEFIANGPLDRWLHHLPKGGGVGGGRSLDWTVRMKIATTLAQGIAFLHDNVKPQVVHRDIRASNVLLDEEFGAHLMGVGLAKFVRWEVMQERISVMAGGTYGYLAPEYVYRNELTTKSDVYSFGVLLLEIISGRRPAQTVDSVGGQQQQSIFEWATPLVHSHRYLDLLDPLIASSSSPSQKDHLPQPGLVQKLVELVYACTQNVPSMRPRMSHVVHQLHQSLLSSN